MTEQEAKTTRRVNVRHPLPPRRKRRVVLWMAFGVALAAWIVFWHVFTSLVGIVILDAMGYFDEAEREFERYTSIQVGMTESEVIRRIGPPDEQYSAEEADGDYYVPSFSHEERRVTGKVLIYVCVPCPPMTWATVYVYLDTSGRVEHVFVGYD